MGHEAYYKTHSSQLPILLKGEVSIACVKLDKTTDRFRQNVSQTDVIGTCPFSYSRR